MSAWKTMLRRALAHLDEHGVTSSATLDRRADVRYGALLLLREHGLIVGTTTSGEDWARTDWSLTAAGRVVVDMLGVAA